jgi:hypothetical protein
MEFVLPIIFGFICTSIFLLYINGYFRIIILLIKNFKLINDTINSITPELVEQAISIFNPNTLNQYASMSNAKKQTHISKSGKCIHIYYEYSGTEYMLTVPYNGLSSVDMIQYQLDAIYENEDILTITQQPGIPYLINTNDLKCKTLKAINHETDVYHFYENDIIPHFCEEICDSK